MRPKLWAPGSKPPPLALRLKLPSLFSKLQALSPKLEALGSRLAPSALPLSLSLGPKLEALGTRLHPAALWSRPQAMRSKLWAPGSKPS